LQTQLKIPIYRGDRQLQRLLLEETPQGGLSCPFGAIHLQLSAQLTDVVCRERYRFYENFSEYGTFPPHPPLRGTFSSRRRLWCIATSNSPINRNLVANFRTGGRLCPPLVKCLHRRTESFARTIHNTKLTDFPSNYLQKCHIFLQIDG